MCDIDGWASSFRIFLLSLRILLRAYLYRLRVCGLDIVRVDI